MSFIIRKAVLSDSSDIAFLERVYVTDELSGRHSDLHAHPMTVGEVKQLINQHWIIVAEHQGEIVGYVIAAKWAFFASQPLYRYIIQRIKFADFDGQSLSTTNTCQYGPVWISQSYRGKGIFEALVNELKLVLKERYPFIVTYIAADNLRSLAAHKNKAGMCLIEHFCFEQRDYQLLVSQT